MTSRTRTRSGCLPCRRRKRKCDGTRPICHNCVDKSDQCHWEHQWRAGQSPRGDHTFHGYAVKCNDALAVPQASEISHDHAVDEDETDVGQLHRNSNGISSPVPQGGIPGDAAGPTEDDHVEHDRLTPTHYAGPRDQYYSRIARRSPLVTSAESTPLSAVASIPARTDVAPFFLGQAISRNSLPSPDPPLMLSDTLRVKLITKYLQETGIWCNTTDSDEHFTVKSVHEMMESKAFTAAAMSLASRQLDHVSGGLSQLTLELYSYTIQLLLRHDPVVVGTSILATCTLLCVYEMMASSVSEWRRHLEGCASLLKTYGWNGNSEGIVKSCFWAFARIDIWAAFILNQSTLIPTASWVHDESITSVVKNGNIDDYCNLAILVFAKIVNIMATDVEGATMTHVHIPSTLRELWEELQTWYQFRPKEVLPLLSAPPTKSSPFPTVLFSRSSSICGNTFFHAGCILLLQTGLLRDDEDLGSSDVVNPRWHAMCLGGISISNNSHANWVNQVQPLYLAGRVLGGCGSIFALNWRPELSVEEALSQRTTSGHSPINAVRTEHYRDSVRREVHVGSAENKPCHDRDMDDPEANDFVVEKMALLKHLVKIERITGWRTSDRAKELRILWGLEH